MSGRCGGISVWYGAGFVNEEKERDGSPCETGENDDEFESKYNHDETPASGESGEEKNNETHSECDMCLKQLWRRCHFQGVTFIMVERRVWARWKYV